jgi:hypothetical protein
MSYVSFKVFDIFGQNKWCREMRRPHIPAARVIRTRFVRRVFPSELAQEESSLYPACRRSTPNHAATLSRQSKVCIVGITYYTTTRRDDCGVGFITAAKTRERTKTEFTSQTDRHPDRVSEWLARLGYESLLCCSHFERPRRSNIPLLFAHVGLLLAQSRS